MELQEREFSAEQRKEFSEKGWALPDGSFPIENESDLRNAVQAVGRASDQATAKRHIIKRARALGALDALPEDWREQMQESERLNLIEAVQGSDGREWDVLIVEAGLSKNGNYYPPETLRAAVPLFEGVVAYADHATEADLRQRKGRSVRDKVGIFRNPEYAQMQLRGRTTEGIKARFKVLAPWLREQMLEAYNANEPDFVGFSIDAGAKVHAREYNGQKVSWVDALGPIGSTDVVDRPSAGGTVIRLVESQQEEMEMDEQAMGTLVEEKIRAALEPVATRIQEIVTAKVDANAEVLQQITSIKESLRVAEGKVRLTEALTTASMSDLSKGRLRQLWGETLLRRDIQEAELQASIKEAQEFEAALAQQFANPTGVSMGRGVQVGPGSQEKYVLGLRGLLSGQDEEGVPRFRTLKEAYARFTRQDYLDVDPLQMFYDFGARYDSGIHHKKIQESLTTASWGEIFADNLYVMMIRQYQNDPQYNQWREVVSDIEDVPDFQTRHWARVGGYADLATVAEQATYPNLTSPTDEEITYVIAKRGGLDDATLEMMTYERGVQKLRAIPNGMARSAARTLYKFVMNLITTDNPNMDYDSVALYNSAHGNTGTTALSLNGVDITQRAMRDQTAYNESSEILGSRNVIHILIVPNELELRAKRIVDPSDAYFHQNADADTSTAIDPQAFKGRGIKVLVYDQLTDATDWWAMADPKLVPTVVMGFWRGQQEPELFIQDNPLVGSAFTADKVTYKVRHVYGGDIQEHRSYYRQVVA